MDRMYQIGLVSVIIPIYNAENVLGEALESVFNQTYKNIEIILVNDCSTDKSGQVIESYLDGHPEILYYEQSVNQGAGVARNKALELAKGQYVAFLDADDIWYPEKIERELDLMQQKKCYFSYTAIEMIDEAGKIIRKKREIPESCDYNYLLHNTLIATSSVIIDRFYFGNFRMSLRRGGQDYATWLCLLRDGSLAYGINEAFVRYRVRNNSLSSNKLESIKQVWEIQTCEEGINKFVAAFHVWCFIVNAIKKYAIN